jgi:Zn-dependent protease
MGSVNIATTIVITLAVIAVSAILHEIMHAIVARKLGDDTAERAGRITLNPLPHIDPIMTVALPVMLAVLGGPIFGGAKPVPVLRHRLKYDEFGMAMVAAAGPFTNLFLAVIGGFIYQSAGVNSVLWNVWWEYFVLINIGFFLFNMIPIPPLDGSRILYAFAPEPIQRFMDQIEPYGIFLLLALVLLGVFGAVLGSLYVLLGENFLGVQIVS